MQRQPTDMVADTEEFYERFFRDLPEFDESRMAFRIRFLMEEYSETMKAIAEQNSEGLVDGLIDFMVVALGTLHEAGVDIRKAWQEVHLANLRKEKNPNPSRFGSAGYDLTKPPGWVGPDHSGNTGKLQEVLCSISPEMGSTMSSLSSSSHTSQG